MSIYHLYQRKYQSSSYFYYSVLVTALATFIAWFQWIHWLLSLVSVNLLAIFITHLNGWLLLRDFKFSRPWRWRQHRPPKHCYPTTSLLGVSTQMKN